MNLIKYLIQEMVPNWKKNNQIMTHQTMKYIMLKMIILSKVKIMSKNVLKNMIDHIGEREIKREK